MHTGILSLLSFLKQHTVTAMTKCMSIAVLSNLKGYEGVLTSLVPMLRYFLFGFDFPSQVTVV